MIPQKLNLTGFLSYRDPIEIDFTTFDLACISGPNGAGKSSLLDAITWVLFGQARRRDDAVINSSSDVTQVSLDFEYEGNLYRVMRAKPRGKTASLEFHLQTPEGDWKPLSERTIRETQTRIDETLRLDYDTFVNAAFFLQGKADEFTQLRPGDRKRILSNILGLETWEVYRQRAVTERKSIEARVAHIDGRLDEIRTELAEGPVRKQRLKSLSTDLERLSQARATKDKLIEDMRKVSASLAEQQKLVDTLARQLETTQETKNQLEDRLVRRIEERATHEANLDRAADIQAEYETWQESKADLERLDDLAYTFREQEARRHDPLTVIEKEKARLEEKRDTLIARRKEIDLLTKETIKYQRDIKKQQSELDHAQADIKNKDDLESQILIAQKENIEAEGENTALKSSMDELKERIDHLQHMDGADCPICGQPLGDQERSLLIEKLTKEGKELGDRFRTNKDVLKDVADRIKTMQKDVQALASANENQRRISRAIDQLQTQIEANESRIKQWEESDAAQLSKIKKSLEKGEFAEQARRELTAIDKQLNKISYDPKAHEEARKKESRYRKSIDALRGLEKTRAALDPLKREIVDLETQIQQLNDGIEKQEKEHAESAEILKSALDQAPDVENAERELLIQQEQENQLRLEVGAANQKVLILDDLKERASEFEMQREVQTQLIGQYKTLERAFSKEGVPALLIEQALPQIESKANHILERLSDGSMSIRFETQREFKDRKREDLKETLDILISDSAGSRDYEMYSGGEAFRINFAIRLALSEVLAQRAGARLQTLVIDEGFGSQDALGRQRLVEAINQVRPDFAKILVITHIDDLKDAFPVRLEVEKTERGSVVHVT